MNVTPMKTLFVYLITVPIFFVIDLAWLGVIAKGFYQKHLGYLMRPQINWAAAILFYLLFIIGIVFFAVRPALESQSPMRALVYGATVRLFRVCHLRLDKPCHRKGLAGYRHGNRPCLGHSSLRCSRLGKLRHFK